MSLTTEPHAGLYDVIARRQAHRAGHFMPAALLASLTLVIWRQSHALQLLRSQGFVLIVHNKSARVRPIDRDFVRDVYEIGVLIEASGAEWAVPPTSTKTTSAFWRRASFTRLRRSSSAAAWTWGGSTSDGPRLRHDVVEAGRGSAAVDAVYRPHALRTM